MKPAAVRARRRGTVVDIAVTGEIDLDNARPFEARLAGAVSNDATLVRIDLSAVDYIDSAGLRALMLIASRLRTGQIDLEVIAPPESLPYRAIAMAGLESLVEEHHGGSRGR